MATDQCALAYGNARVRKLSSYSSPTLRLTAMSATTKFQKAYMFGSRAGTAAITAAILGSAFLGNALAADKPTGMPHGSMGSMGSMEMHKSMMGGMKNMESMKGSGNIDYDFAVMMKMHHQSALDMANVQLQKGKDATLRKMATDIIKSQTKEIKAFDDWLAKNEKPVNMPTSKPK